MASDLCDAVRALSIVEPNASRVPVARTATTATTGSDASPLRDEPPPPPSRLRDVLDASSQSIAPFLDDVLDLTRLEEALGTTDAVSSTAWEAPRMWQMLACRPETSASWLARRHGPRRRREVAAFLTANAAAALERARPSAASSRDAFVSACTDLAARLADGSHSIAMLDLREALVATAAAVRGGLTSVAALPRPQRIGSEEGRRLALTADLAARGMRLRSDSVLCAAFLQRGVHAEALRVARADGVRTDDDALVWLVDCMAEMAWLHSRACGRASERYGVLVRGHRIYEDAYTDPFRYARASRMAKLLAVRAMLDDEAAAG